MMLDLTLYQFEASPFSDKVRRVLHAKGRDYEIREVSPAETLMGLRRLGPTGRVPVLVHGETAVSDSSRIARYVERAFPDPPLLPAGGKARALCHILEDWADECLYFFELWFRFAVPENAPEWSRKASETDPPLLRGATQRAMPTLMRNVLKAQGLGRREPQEVLLEFGRHLEAVEGWLAGGSWLVDDTMTLADIAVYAQLACAAETGEAAAVLAERPGVLRWMERVNGATAGPDGG